MGFLSSIFGKKPKVPDFVPVDYDKEYDAATDYNEENIERFGGISRKAQEQDQQALTQGLRSAIPNYDELLASEFDITSSLLRGELSKREKDRMRDRRAALGLSSGTQDADLTQYSYARDLGLAERDLVNQGMAYADNRIRRQSAFVAQPVSVTSMFQSPQERIAQKMSERDSKFKRDNYAAKIDAMPDPVMSGIFNNMSAAAGASGGGGGGGGGFSGLFSGGGGGGIASAIGTIAGAAIGGPAGAAIGGQLGGFIGGVGGGGSNASGLATNHSYSASTYGAQPVAGSSGGFHQPMWGQGGLAYSTNSYTSGANFGNKPFGM